ncbi:NAD(P)/FAD-dependent oxidoreductase [Streptomyces sp. NPDC053048]|uniref:NAD(P)/FAD-dependent oxidoreductase n=1 Tax=Streptomyces sp. NPDC053048 TaxID=3365694 RepID=UPI0037D73E85
MTGTRPAAVDVAVVGGGVIGCMTAREILRRAPGTSVALLERDAVASGATRRSAGLHFPRGATERVRAMSGYSQDHYARLKKEHPRIPVHELGMTVVADAAAGDRLREVYLGSTRLSPVSAVPGDVVRLPPGSTAWTGEGCQYADVHALTRHLARELREQVAFREGVEVKALDAGASGVVLSLSTGEAVRAERVVLAPGPWLDAPAWRDLVRPLGARVKRVVALHIEKAPAEGDGAVVFHDEDAFLLPLYDRGHWLFSYTCREWDVDPDDSSPALSAAHLYEAQDVLSRYAPALAEHCASGQVFCDAYSPTGEPLITLLEGNGRLIFAGAANGSGYRLAPAIAARAVDLLVPTPSDKDGNDLQ